jgi:hypothetical protein
MSQTGSTTLTTSAATIYESGVDAGPAFSTYRVRNRGAVDIEVNVQGLHAAGQYAVIPPGDSEVFRRGVDRIEKVTARSTSSTAVANHYPVAQQAGA